MAQDVTIKLITNMTKYTKFIIPVLLALNIVATGYVWWAQTSNTIALQINDEQLANALLQTICVTRVTGIIDLNQCPQ